MCFVYVHKVTLNFMHQALTSSVKAIFTILPKALLPMVATSIVFSLGYAATYWNEGHITSLSIFHVLIKGLFFVTLILTQLQVETVA